MHGDEVGFDQGVIEFFEQLDTEAFGAVLRQVGVVGDDAHAEGLGALGELGTDAAHAEDGEGLAVDLGALEALAVPFAGDDAGMRLRRFASERHHEGEGLLGGGDGVAAGGVHHHHTTLAGSGDVDVVDADPGTSDGLEVLRRFNDFGRHLDPTAHDDGMGILGGLGEVGLGLQAQLDLDGERRLRLQEFDAFFGDGICDEDLELLGHRGAQRRRLSRAGKRHARHDGPCPGLTHEEPRGVGV